MNCLCYERKKKLYNYNKEYWEKIEKITSPKLDPDGKSIDIKCNYILCEKSVKSGLEKNIILNNNHYAFCSDNCWNTWLLSGQNLRHYVSPNISPLINSNSPEYLSLYKNSTISNIPPLFI